MNIFNAGDILQFAIRIEEDGEIFYHKAAMNAQGKEVRDFFNNLADEEIRHKRVFSEMLQGIDLNTPAESFRGEYAAYLRDYIDGKVVFTKEDKSNVATGNFTTLEAIHFAIGREVDSILYYHEIKQFVDKKHHDEIDRIIDEERRHFIQLSDMDKKFR
ncbi:MAG: ferritin-like domain-containing protein [Syntrophorhabdaceae bacterium]